MKRCKGLLAGILILCLMLVACDCYVDATYPPSSTQTYHDYTNQELLDLICREGYLNAWGAGGNIEEYSIAGLTAFSTTCPPLAELLSRPSAMQTLQTYGPELVAHYEGETRDSLEKLLGWVFQIDLPDPTEEAPIDFTEYTDLELLEAICNDGYLEEWSLRSDEAFLCISGLVSLTESCPPLAELLHRPSAAESVRIYAPELMENASLITSAALPNFVYVLTGEYPKGGDRG